MRQYLLVALIVGISLAHSASLEKHPLLPNAVGTDPTVYVSDANLAKMIDMAAGKETTDITKLVSTNKQELKDALTKAIQALKDQNDGHGSGSEGEDDAVVTLETGNIESLSTSSSADKRQYADFSDAEQAALNKWANEHYGVKEYKHLKPKLKIEAKRSLEKRTQSRVKGRRSGD